jgi:hypothetical protein
VLNYTWHGTGVFPAACAALFYERRFLILNRLFRYLAVIVAAVLMSASFFSVNAAESPAEVKVFSDVPENNPAFKAVNDLRALGVTQGVGNNLFGLGKPLTRGEFVTWLVRVTGLKQVSPEKGSFSDNLDKTKYYYAPVETALQNGIISKSDKFRPSSYLTREEMAIMLVRCLGYDNIAAKLAYLGKPYDDTAANTGYITMVTDFGLMDATGTLFKPGGSVLREQAAVSLMRLYEKSNAPILDLNAFYAIKSDPQKDKIPDLTSICFGWSRLTFDAQAGQVVLNTVRDGTANQEYYVPDGFAERVQMARQAGIPAMLSVFATQDVRVADAASGSTVGLVEYVLTKPGVGEKLIEDITALLENTSRDGASESFDGVVIDFEGLKGEAMRTAFNGFLEKLRAKLDETGKKLYVTVNPRIAAARSSACFDGYDFKTIGSLADKVILMAHDYNAKNLMDSDMARGFTETPLTPLEDVYYALKTITDKNEGVQDKSRIMLQMSFSWPVWQKKDGKVLNRKPLNYDYENFLKLLSGDFTMNYSQAARNPSLKFTDAAAGIENTVWYEDSRSVSEKIKLAEMFGIQGISLWRLGLIPDFPPQEGSKPVYMDVWQTILSKMGDKKP